MKKWVLVLAVCMSLLIMNVVVQAEGRVILALGDSISAGYGLDDRKGECFVSLMAFSSDTVVNKAVDGNKAIDIIDQLTNTDNENYISPADIEKANIVTVTCGGNDMMALLYEKIAAEYPNVHPRKKEITADEVLSRLAEKDLYAISAALRVLDKDKDVYYMNDGDFDVRLTDFVNNLLWITDYINKINPDAKIVVATQYNPYAEFSNSGYKVLYLGIEDGATRLNAEILKNAEGGCYTVADVKSTFDQYTGDEDLYNAKNDVDINLDFHPSKAGHELIAQVFANIINIHYLGKENEDGTYFLPDNVVGYYITDYKGNVRFVDAGVYKAQEGDSVEAVYINVSMVDGAQVKIKNSSGLRFISLVDRSYFDAVGYGMKITSEENSEEIFVDASLWQNDSCFTVAIDNIKEENYRRNYIAQPFVRVVYDDGKEKLIVGKESVKRSIYTVAKGLLDKGEAEETLKQALMKYVN